MIIVETSIVVPRYKKLISMMEKDGHERPDGLVVEADVESSVRDFGQGIGK